MTESLPGGAPLGENFALQHPKDYVAALGATVKAAVKESGINPEYINGIGMDLPRARCFRSIRPENRSA